MYPEWLPGGLALGLPLLIYWLTAAPTVYWLDSAELTTGAYSLGIVHAPGSPLFLMLGHLFTFLPIGDVGHRLNLFTAVTSGLSAWFIYLILAHLTAQRLTALFTSWFVAFTFYVWLTAVAAELYSLLGCLVVGLLFLALKWRQQQRPWQLCLLAFLFGLGTGNHMALVLTLPGFTLLALSTPLPWWQPRWLLLATLCGLLGGTVYLYIPLRYLADPAMNYAEFWHVDLATWSGFWWMITGQMFESLFFAVPLAQLPGKVFEYLYFLWSNFVGAGTLIALWGLYSDFRDRRILHISLLVMFIGHLSFYVPYAAIDQRTMLIPTYMIWGIWIGLGVYHLGRRFPKPVFGELTAAPLLLLTLALTSLGFNYGYLDISDDWSAHTRGEEIFKAIGPDALYMGTWVDIPILEYLQIVESRRGDVRLVELLFTSDDQEKHLINDWLARDRPVYTSSEEVFTDKTYKRMYLEACQCYEVENPTAGAGQ